MVYTGFYIRVMIAISQVPGETKFEEVVMKTTPQENTVRAPGHDRALFLSPPLLVV
jgi:hypothetical protein